MHLKKLGIGLALVLLLMGNVWPDRSFGTLRFGEEGLKPSAQSLGDLNFAGALAIKRRKAGYVRGAGFCRAKQATLKGLSLAGNLTARATTFEGEVKVTGWLRAKKCRFDGPLKLCSNCVELTDCQTKSILFEENGGGERVETLYLNNANVEGEILFRGGKGRVIVDPKSRIAGDVQGGVIQPKRAEGEGRRPTRSTETSQGLLPEKSQSIETDQHRSPLVGANGDG